MNTVRVRVALIMIKDDSILMIKHRKDDSEYWLVPGGGIEYGETVEQALRREIMEECGVEIEVDRFAFSCETIGGHHRHILHLFFTGKILSGKLKLGTEGNLVGLGFMKIAELPTITVYPKVTDTLMKLARGGSFEPRHIFGNIWED
ncbi:MAG: NUDIX domain-containing protein [Candidatus Wallbacteria bacterium]|nr:NUDIX domain-containing protein [Candidatus Wallbacteria bacterium]